MRIAMFQNILPEPGRKPGGVSIYVHRLSQALADRGHAVEVFTYSAPPPGARYRTRALPLAAAKSRRVLRQYISPWLVNRLDLRGFDVAHFHGEDWFYLRRTLPVVRTFHGSALLEAQTATSVVRRLDKRVVYRLELLARRLATASYGVGVDSERIYRTDGLLAPGVYIPAPTDARASRPTILFVGTWSGRKRGSLLHEVFLREVRRAIPNAELWMVSDESKPGDGVRWIETPSDDELNDLYARAWVFCMPSAYEGFGIPYLEAMAHGTPVVTTPNPGAGMILEGGRYGVLADEEELGRCLVELLEDEGGRRSLAARARARAESYSWQRSCEQHELAYATAVERFSGGRRI